MKKYLLSIIAGSVLLIGITGCNNNNNIDNQVQPTEILLNQTTTDNTTDKTISINAEDAYVKKLNSPAEIKLSDGSIIRTTKVDNGKIIFSIVPNDNRLNGAILHIPRDAEMDVDYNNIFDGHDSVVYGDLFAVLNSGNENINVNFLSTMNFLAKGDTNYITVDPLKSLDNLLTKIINNPENYPDSNSIVQDKDFRTFLINETLAKLNKYYIKCVISNSQPVKNIRSLYESNMIKFFTQEFDGTEFLNYINSTDDINTLTTIAQNALNKIDYIGIWENQNTFKIGILKSISTAPDIAFELKNIMSVVNALALPEEQKAALINQSKKIIFNSLNILFNSDVSSTLVLQNIQSIKGDINNYQQYYNNISEAVANNSTFNDEVFQKLPKGQQSFAEKDWNYYK